MWGSVSRSTNMFFQRNKTLCEVFGNAPLCVTQSEKTASKGLTPKSKKKLAYKRNP